MRILMTESDPRAGSEVDEVLSAAGHEVVRCTDSSGAPFPCRGVAGGTCPLDEGVAVAVSAPGTIPPEPVAGEIGLICALRRHVPFLVVSPDHAEGTDARPGYVGRADLVAEVERVATAPLPLHTEVVRAEARRILGDGADATVVRDGTGLNVTIDVPAGTDRRLVESAAVRAKGAVRRIDHWATVVDVNVG
jgi:hypothetical protein